MNIVRLYFKNYRGISLYGWVNIFSALINSGASVSIIFLSLYLTKIFNFSAFSIGIVVTSYGVGAMSGALIGGVACDYLSSQVVCVISLFLNGIALVTLPFLNDYHFIMIITFIMGISNYAFSPANRINIMESTSGSDQIRINSLRYMMVNVGIGLYVFLGGRIAKISYSLLFITNGLLILANAFLLLYFINWPKPQNNFQIKEANHQQKFYLQFFVYAYLGVFFITMIFSQLRITYPLYMHHYYHLDEQLFSNIFLVNTLLIVALQVPMSNFIQKFNPLMTSGTGALLIGLGIGVTYFGNTYEYAIFLCLFWTVGEILFFSTSQAMIYERATPGHKGKYMGLAQMTAALSNIIGPITGSWLYGLNDARYLWLMCLAFGIATFSIHFRLYAHEVKEEVLVG